MSQDPVKLEEVQGDETALVVHVDRVTAFGTMLDGMSNTYLDWRGLEADGPRQQMPAEDVAKVVEGIRSLHEMIVRWRGKDPRPHADPPLPCVVADLVRQCVQTFLDQQVIVCWALELLAQLWEDRFLKKLTNIKGLPDLQQQLHTIMFMGIKQHGHAWIVKTKSSSALTGMTNIGPDRHNQVQIDKYLAEARGFMTVKDITVLACHTVVRCAILLLSVLYWELMSTMWEKYYLIEVSGFALWLVNTFKEGVGEELHPGALGCELLYHIAVRNMTGAQARVVPHDGETQQWFRKHKIPQVIMSYWGFSHKHDQYISEILQRVSAPADKRAREPSPPADDAGPSKARRRLGGAA